MASGWIGWPTVIITAVVALLIGSLLGGSGDASTPTAAPEPTVTVTATETTAAEPSAEPSKAPTKAPEPEKPGIPTTIGEGNYEVGVDVQAGRYKTSVAEGDLCYWARNKDDSGDSIMPTSCRTAQPKCR
jgi:hypothetical protein